MCTHDDNTTKFQENLIMKKFSVRLTIDNVIFFKKGEKCKRIRSAIMLIVAIKRYIFPTLST